jgi:hypothetical protein
MEGFKLQCDQHCSKCSRETHDAICLRWVGSAPSRRRGAVGKYETRLSIRMHCPSKREAPINECSARGGRCARIQPFR